MQGGDAPGRRVARSPAADLAHLAGPLALVAELALGSRWSLALVAATVAAAHAPRLPTLPLGAGRPRATGGADARAPRASAGTPSTRWSATATTAATASRIP